MVRAQPRSFTVVVGPLSFAQRVYQIASFVLRLTLVAGAGGQKFIDARARILLRKFCEKFLGLDIMGEYRRIHFDDG